MLEPACTTIVDCKHVAMMTIEQYLQSIYFATRSSDLKEH